MPIGLCGFLRILRFFRFDRIYPRILIVRAPRLLRFGFRGWLAADPQRSG